MLLKKGTQLFHITRIDNEKSFIENGIKIQHGNVNAQGKGFYMTEKIDLAFQWNHAEDKKYFLNEYCIVFCTVLNDIPDNNNGDVIISEKEVVWKKFNSEGEAVDLEVEKVIVIKNLAGTEKEKLEDYLKNSFDD
ncbi:hypothetical protein [Dickeya fangzhongdai]|uniref:hypothetical protein n=1 Tax=Dickeya fangzhongdai TaxID=1778540 RepID=UPI00103D870F|nr:hypothetical protein [Dickeya fangzhongdai]